MASGSWGFQLLSRQQPSPPRARELLQHKGLPPPTTRSNTWKSSSSRVLLLTRPPTALRFRDWDMPDQITVHDEALHDTIADMASFLTLRVGMAMLRRQQIKRKQKEQGAELLLRASRSSTQYRRPRQENVLQEKPLHFSVSELDDALESTNRLARENLAALERTVEEVRLAQAKLGAIRKTAAQAIAEALEPQSQHSVLLNSSVEATLAVPEELDMEPVIIPVIFQVASRPPAAKDMDTESHSVLHKKEGDRVIALEDEASSVGDFGRLLDVLQDAVLPDVHSCLSTDFRRPHLDVLWATSS
jgi:hypothetical protein